MSLFLFSLIFLCALLSILVTIEITFFPRGNSYLRLANDAYSVQLTPEFLLLLEQAKHEYSYVGYVCRFTNYIRIYKSTSDEILYITGDNSIRQILFPSGEISEIDITYYTGDKPDIAAIAINTMNAGEALTEKNSAKKESKSFRVTKFLGNPTKIEEFVFISRRVDDFTVKYNCHFGELNMDLSYYQQSQGIFMLETVAFLEKHHPMNSMIFLKFEVADASQKNKEKKDFTQVKLEDPCLLDYELSQTTGNIMKAVITEFMKGKNSFFVQ
jgi:hypothetical protein